MTTRTHAYTMQKHATDHGCCTWDRAAQHQQLMILHAQAGTYSGGESAMTSDLSATSNLLRHLCPFYVSTLAVHYHAATVAQNLDKN